MSADEYFFPGRIVGVNCTYSGEAEKGHEVSITGNLNNRDDKHVQCSVDIKNETTGKVVAKGTITLNVNPFLPTF
jgi:acyl-CoA thioesterase FadM